MRLKTTFIGLLLFSFVGLYAQFTYTASSYLDVNVLGNTTPYFLVANRHGITSIDPNTFYLRGAVSKPINEKKRFDWGATIDLIAGVGQYNTPVLLQQAYIEGKIYAFDIMAGAKEQQHELLNTRLSSGGMTWSGNARPIPQVRIGFLDFTAIPYTKEWIQVKAGLSYGLFADNRYLENTYNFQYNWITTNILYHNKYAAVRTKENFPVVLTALFEVANQFGGRQRSYSNGTLINDFNLSTSVKDFWNILLPSKGDDSGPIGDKIYYYGNTLGSWFYMIEGNLSSDMKIKAYYERFFEVGGSALYKSGGWDGLYGIEFAFGKNKWIEQFLFEYVDTRNQGGPVSWNPDDHDTEIEWSCDGAFEFYNNYYYNSWSHFGMGNGSPLLPSPIYNRDGYLAYSCNKIRAFHFGVIGHITPQIEYKLLGHYKQGWGTSRVPSEQLLSNKSIMIEINYSPKAWKNWDLWGKVAADWGNIYGNNLGIEVGIRSSGSLSILNK